MAVTIETEDAPEAAPAAISEDDAERASLVDELSELTDWYATVKGRIDRIDEIKKALVADVNERFEDRAMSRAVEGTVAIATIGPAAQKRIVTAPKRVHEMLGDEAFYAGITVPLGFIDKYLTEQQRGEVTETEDTGPRKVTVKARNL